MDAALNVKFGADTTALITGINKVEVTLAGLQSRLKDLQNQRLNIVDPVQLGVINRQIDGITGQIAKFKAVGTEAFDAVSKKVDGVTEATGGLVKGVNEGYSAIRRLAFILPGIGIAGIFNLAFEAISSTFKKADEAVSEASEKLKEYKKTVDSVVESNSKESSTVDILVGKLQSGTLSRQQTVEAIKELQKISPDYFGKLNAEKISIDEVTKAYGNYNNALVKTIETQIRIAEITDIVKQRLAQSNATPEAAKFIADLQAQGKSLDEINAIVVKGIGQDIRAQAQLVQGSKNLTDEQAKQALLQAKVPGGVQTILKLLEQEADIIKNINQISDIVKPPKVTGTDQLDATGRALEEIIKLEDELAKQNELPLFQRLANSLDVSRAQLISNKIAEVLRNNVKNGIDGAITEKEVALLYEKLRRLLNPNLTSKVDVNIPVDPHVQLVNNLFAKEGAIGPQLTSVLRGLPAIKTDIKVDPNLVLNNTEFAKANTKIKETIGQAGTSIAEGLAADFGKAFAGVKNPFGNIAELLGQGLEEIGKQLIIVGGLSQLIQKLLPTVFTPAGAITSIVVGGLAIAAGAALKAISSTKGVKAFAEGGIVTGPTNALIGEAGPEVVFPLDKLNRFIKGNTQNSRVEVVGQTIISGPNLITVLKRAQTNQGMV